MESEREKERRRKMKINKEWRKRSPIGFSVFGGDNLPICR
jgi:hypothetical protein